MFDITLEYETDEDVDDLLTEQWYYSLVDGETFMLTSIDEDEVVVVDMTGETRIHEREGMIFNPECVWSDIIPLKWVHIEVDQDPSNG